MCYMTNRSQVGVREIRQNLSVYLDRVKAGEAIEITERGQPVAVLGPLPDRSTVLQRLVAEGRATAPTASRSTLGPPLRIRLRAGKSMQEILDYMKEDRL
jgi:prevent-host-death family protein